VEKRFRGTVVVRDYMGAGVVQGCRCTGVVQVFNGHRRSTEVQVTGVVEG
jgi:hypothetical protein